MTFDKAHGSNFNSTFIDSIDGVRSLAASHDGSCIVSASWDKTIKVWDLKYKGLSKTIDKAHDGKRNFI